MSQHGTRHPTHTFRTTPNREIILEFRQHEWASEAHAIRCQALIHASWVPVIPQGPGPSMLAVCSALTALVKSGALVEERGRWFLLTDAPAMVDATCKAAYA